MSTISLLCVFASIVVQHVLANIGRPCLNLNPHIEVLRAKKVAIYENSTSETQSNPCFEEWKVNGTCCNLASVKDYVNRDRAEVSSYFQRIGQAMMQINQTLLKFEAYALDLYNKDYFTLGKPFSDFIKFYLHDLKVANVPLRESIVNESFYSLFDQNSPHLAKTKACRQLLMNLRTNSLCSVCSGRSNETFFDNTTKKARLGTPHCRTIMQSCAIPFFYLMNYTKSLYFFAGYSRMAGYELFLVDPNFNLLYQNFMQTYTHINSNLQLVSRLASYPFVTDPAMKLTFEKYFCNVMIRVSKDLFFKGWLDQVDQLQRYLNYMFERIDSINKQWKVMSANYPRRILQQPTNAVSEFEGDVTATEYTYGAENNLGDPNSNVIMMNLYNSTMW